jgi:CheY-like chemotaxis protein
MVSVDAPVGLHAVGDTHQLEQVVVNLTVNAAQSIPATRRGHVVIRATHEAEHVLVEVADDGVGIPDELQHRIFEPFFTTKALGEGTGLGLAVSMGLVRSLGGSLRLLESSSSGTRMGVNLRWSPAGPSNDAVAAVVSHTAPKKLRLLLVDDEPAVRAALRRVLATRFSVETADGVTSALELVRTRDFDVVVCDVMMPDGGGGRLHEELARWRPDLAARTVFVTGASVEHAARELQVDRRRILTKPLDVDALCSLLDERALIRDEVTALSA